MRRISLDPGSRRSKRSGAATPRGGNMRHPLLLVVTAVSLQLLGLSVVGHAAGTAGQVCAAAKLKATAKAASDSVTCHAKATQKGIGADPSCLAKAETRLTDAFAKAEVEGGCVTAGDASAIDALVGSSVGAFVGALRPVADANRCAAAKLKAAGKKAKTKLGCHAKAAKQGGLVDPGCLAKAEERFTAAFGKAEGKPPCLTSGDAAAVEDSVDGLVDDAVSALPPATTTTTTTTTLPTACGNGVIEGDEQCDGQANCVDCLLGVPLCCSLGCFVEIAPPGESGNLLATVFLNSCGRGGGAGYIGRTCEPLPC